MPSEFLTSVISRYIWNTKYRYAGNEKSACESDIRDAWRRVARAVASVEPNDRAVWEQRFYDVLTDFRFLPGGRILAGAGTGRRVTLFNCFVMGLIEDSLDGIFEALKEGALTMQQGGGVGYDFSTLRPKGAHAQGIGGIASGPVSFMTIWDSTCATVLSAGSRRGAMMATLRCDHPDIEAFIDVKENPQLLRHFNLSVQITDEFMRAVAEDREWPLVFPVAQLKAGDRDSTARVISRRWPGLDCEVQCQVFRILRARDLWQRILRANYNYAEPGVLFVDRINRANNLWYCENITATNPCGEIPLPPYGACNLGSINLARFVKQPFTPNARLDLQGILGTARIATRMLDNVIDLSRFPLEAQREQAKHSRRIGLGITGLADALIMLGRRYGEESSYQLASNVMRSICDTAYSTSVELAVEKGVFPAFDKAKFLQGQFVQQLSDELQGSIAKYGLRNSHLIAIAPTGTISLLAENVSSGLEPVYDFRYTRRVIQPDGQQLEFQVEDYAWRLWQTLYGDTPLAPYFLTARSLPPGVQVKMQAALQAHVDNAISKTINVPGDLKFAAFKSLYDEAYAMGLKGCTTFRPNPVSGAILSSHETTEYKLCSCEL